MRSFTGFKGNNSQNSQPIVVQIKAQLYIWRLTLIICQLLLFIKCSSVTQIIFTMITAMWSFLENLCLEKMHQNETRYYLLGNRNMEATHSLIFLSYEFSKLYLMCIYFSCRKNVITFIFLKVNRSKNTKNSLTLAFLTFRPSNIVQLLFLLKLPE
jgi:hypothetical protein